MHFSDSGHSPLVRIQVGGGKRRGRDAFAAGADAVVLYRRERVDREVHELRQPTRPQHLELHRRWRCCAAHSDGRRRGHRRAASSGDGSDSEQEERLFAWHGWPEMLHCGLPGDCRPNNICRCPQPGPERTERNDVDFGRDNHGYISKYEMTDRPKTKCGRDMFSCPTTNYGFIIYTQSQDDKIATLI